MEKSGTISNIILNTQDESYIPKILNFINDDLKLEHIHFKFSIPKYFIEDTLRFDLDYHFWSYYDFDFDLDDTLENLLQEISNHFNLSIKLR